MNRDIVQLVTLLAQMQSDIARQQTGIAGLAKDVQKLSTSIYALDPDRINGAAANGASLGAAKEVAKAAESASRAGDFAKAISVTAGAVDRKRRRWKIGAVAVAIVLIFVTGAWSALFVGQSDRYGCLAYGGEWIEKPGLKACVFR